MSIVSSSVDVNSTVLSFNISFSHVNFLEDKPELKVFHRKQLEQMRKKLLDQLMVNQNKIALDEAIELKKFIRKEREIKSTDSTDTMGP